MLELILAILGTILVMLLPFRMVNVRRMRAWAARDSMERARAHELSSYEAARRAMREEHEEALAGQEETQGWADSILLGHDWHIGGKADPHDRGVLVRYECACGAVTHAEEGAL